MMAPYTHDNSEHESKYKTQSMEQEAQVQRYEQEKAD